MVMSDPGLISVLQKPAGLINLAKSSSSVEERSTELNRTGFMPHLCWILEAFWSYHFGFGLAYVCPKRWQSCWVQKSRFALQSCLSASSFVTSDGSLHLSPPVSLFIEHMELSELWDHFSPPTWDGSGLLSSCESPGNLMGYMWFVNGSNSPMKNEDSEAMVSLNYLLGGYFC